MRDDDGFSGGHDTAGNSLSNPVFAAFFRFVRDAVGYFYFKFAGSRVNDGNRSVLHRLHLGEIRNGLGQTLVEDKRGRKFLRNFVQARQVL